MDRLGERGVLDQLIDAVRAGGSGVLVVRAERGFLSTEDADELRQRVPHAQVVDVAAGHNVQEDEPVLLAEIVNRFLAGTR